MLPSKDKYFTLLPHWRETKIVKIWIKKLPKQTVILLLWTVDIFLSYNTFTDRQSSNEELWEHYDD